MVMGSVQWDLNSRKTKVKFTDLSMTLGYVNKTEK